MVSLVTFDIPLMESKNWLIHLLYLRKEYEKCLDIIREQISESHNSCEFPLYMQGMIYRQQGRIQESLELFQKCTILHPGKLTYLKQLAKSLLLMGRFKAALELFSEIITKFDEKDWQIYHDQGIAQFFLQKYPNAIDCFLKAIEVKPEEDSFLMLAKVHVTNGNLEAALEVYKRAIELFPDCSQLFGNIGLLYLQHDDFKKAGDCLDRAANLDPGNQSAIIASGSIKHSLGDYDGAMNRYRQAALGCPDSAALWNNVGMCYFEKGKHLTAISCLKRATYLSPMDWKILFNLGLVHLTVGLNASAFHYISASIAQKPRAKLFMFLGIALFRLDDRKNAKMAYEQALAMDKTGDPAITFNAALFHLAQGDAKQSEELCIICLENIAKIKTSGRNLDEQLVKKASLLRDFLKNGNRTDTQSVKEVVSNISAARLTMKPFETDKDKVSRGSSFFQTMGIEEDNRTDDKANISRSGEKKNVQAYRREPTQDTGDIASSSNVVNNIQEVNNQDTDSW